MLGEKCIAILCDAKPILYSNSYNLCSNSLFTFDTVLTDGMVTGHHHLRRIKNVYYALWADVGVLFSRGGYRDEFPYRGIPRYGGPYRDTYRDIPRNL